MKRVAGAVLLALGGSLVLLSVPLVVHPFLLGDRNHLLPTSSLWRVACGGLVVGVVATIGGLIAVRRASDDAQ